MSESDIYEWLQKYDIPIPEFRVFSLSEELCVNFYPVALKILSPKVVHKSDVGGVIINIKNGEELQEAKTKIIDNLETNKIDLDENDHLIVTRMYSGVELFFGIIDDPVFEKVIVFGAGGVYVELFKDICYIDSEAGEAEIKSAILQTKISTLFTKGFRGKKYDIDLVVGLVRKLQQLDAKELDLNPVIMTGESLVVVDARILPEVVLPHHKMLKYIPEVFSPERVAVIGVSAHPEKVGYALAKNASGFSSSYFVNPHLDNLFDKKVYKNISELPFIDTVVLCIPASAIRDSIEQLAIKGVKNVIIITAGFKEEGRDETFLLELAEKHQLNIIGPNCLGIYASQKNLTFGTSHIIPGQLNLFSQSGAILAELMDKAVFENTGFENIISVGNMADVDFADLINSYTGTNPVNLYIEGIANGKNLLRAIRKSRSPVKVFKAGRSEAAKKSAFSHTGNLAGNYELFVGLLKSAGVRMLDNINGLLSPHHFSKVLIITNAGGAGTVMSDLAGDKLYKLSTTEINQLSAILPPNWSKNNPVDIIGEATHERYLKVLQLADSFEADAIFVLVTPQFMTDMDKICEIFIENCFQTKVFPVLLGGEMMVKAKNRLLKKKIKFFEDLNDVVASF